MAKSKREIDKEIMFQKIMPSGLRTPENGSAEPGGNEPSAVSAAVQTPADRIQKPARQIGSAILSESGVQFTPKSNTILVNVMEQLVVEKLDAAFAKFNCCKCDKCRKDVAAIALNKLLPKYVVAEPQQLPRWAALQSSAEVSTAIVQGILQVRAHPRH